ncbi:MAG TPA: cyclic nucleotide-binding domain-containing protein [Anaeromyxobacteraceae bacterium]|jgi:CRP-like cAMP-binding protein|nr:cyclic nucleotide-binding domain-containing protein [Anaeromyxobacteraceae bacterium]
MTTVEKVLWLQKLDLFAGAPGEDLVAVAAAVEEVEAAPGEVLARAGEPGGALHLLTEGKLRVRSGGASVEVPPGRAFGALEVFAPAPWSATVEAAAPSKLLRLERDDLDGILAGRPALARSLLAALAARVRAARTGSP